MIIYKKIVNCCHKRPCYIILVHNSSFYGSNLWDLAGEKASKVYTAWNTAVKLAWCCPQYTRTYILQQMLCCGFTSAKVDILSRYVKFFHGLRSIA